MIVRYFERTFSFFGDFFFTLNNHERIFILVKNNQVKYFCIPFFINIIKKKKNEIVFIYSESEKLNFDRFFSLVIENAIFRFNKKKLKLKGLGMKMNLTKDNDFLHFKLGLSHSIFIFIPKNEIKILIKGNLLVIESFDKVTLGNYVQQIKDLYLPDVYKGRGFLFSNEKILLKEVKKK